MLLTCCRNLVTVRFVALRLKNKQKNDFMAPPKHTEVKRGIAVLWETLQCPICLDLLTKPVSTKCDHQFCKFCMLKLLDNAKQSKADCPVCKEKITKRSLQESPGFQRLVTGLQDMIQAYEHDTGTNYLTGLAQERRRAGLNDDKRVDGTPDNVEDVEKAPPSSHTSTIAALNGFARVMGFGDSDPVATEGEVEDGSVQTSQSIKSMEATANASRLATRGKRRKDQVVPVVSEIQPLTRLSRQKQKKDEVPEQIFENRKKKSKQKVAEWLMRAPAEGSLELAQPADVAQAFDDSDSSASTLDLRTLGKKEQVAKTLEEHVFGVTYTRKQRGNQRASNTSRSHSSEKLSEKRKKMTGTEDKLVHLEAPAIMDISEEPGNCETQKTELDKSPENDELTILGALHPERKPTKRSHSALQEVDSDLQAKAETESSAPKKADRRRGPSERGKSARAVQPLVLVGVQDGGDDAKSKLPSEAAQVHIENYPSSEDQEAAVTTGTGRSRRLHLSSQNVRQAAPQKAATRQGARALRKDVKDDGTSDLAAAKACKSNGCVYDKDICAIENMDISHLETLVQGVRPSESEAGADREPPLIPSCAGVLGAAPRSMQSAPAEKEDCHDSEMDTAQILRSFKDTKRKSFRLARQSGKKSRSQDEELAHSSGKRCLTRLAVQRSKQQQQQTTQSSDLTDPSTCSDLLPPTNLPAKKMDANVVAAPVLLRSSISSGLSPNKVTTRETESPLASMLPQVVDSGLRFHERQEIPESPFDPAATGNSSASTSQHVVHADCSLTPDGLGVQPSQPPHGTQTSLRSSARSSPSRRRRRRTRRLRYSSGVDEYREQQSLSSSQDTPSTLPPIFHGAAARPHGHRADDAAEAHQHKADDVAVRCESPDCITASQASVDLFDSPEECDAPVNDASVSAESSQFASEVLVTQQKLEMQKELLRLEKLMALVTEVLQEKEANSAVCSDAPKSDPRDPNASCDPDREDLGRNAEELGKRLRDGEHLSQPAIETSPHAGPAGKSCGRSKDKENTTPERDGGRAKMMLVSSGLAPAEQMAVRRFARRVGARVVSQVTAEVTHIVMCTDEQLVCERTLKYFLGIAGRKWVVSFQWIAECFKQKKLVDESLFEVRGDVVNGSDHLGPKRARTTADDNLLMKGYEICFQGPFANMTTEEMEWMVQQCGATVVKDPLVLDSTRKSNQLVIVQPGTDPRSYSGLAKQATLVSRGWLLDTVATYTLQGYANYLI
ncbi:breast cancer type 1 susceptibility protein homolog isoform X3 [Hippocampus comes]|uniref:breast cancer type 1 susceptibility protein homolog isoform X3 n=1 Tax=Hippocampus comes TaxID=109280 RepID=UPI00094F21C3|nr:PREDICTED: breast cancer type 1 susceptibility protein isoform X3 [Hippocampus comes]